MPSRDLHNNVAVRPAINPQAITAAGTTAGAIIDTNGFASCEFAIAAGAISAGASLVPKLEDGDESDLSDAAEVAAAGLLGTIAGATFDGADDNTAARLGYRGHKRYVRLSLVATSIDGAASGTATLATGLAVDEKVTIESHDFVAKAKYATGTVAFSTIVADNVVTVNGTAFTAKVSPSGAEEFALGASDTEAMTNFCAKVDAHTTVSLVVATTDNEDGTCTLTAVTAGADGNAITLAKTGTPITISGSTLTGAYDPASDQWPIESTLALSATALAAQISASTTEGIAGVVSATAAAAVVTITADTPGTGGNALTLTKTGDHITVSGSGTLAGGTDGSATMGAVCILGHPTTLAPVA